VISSKRRREIGVRLSVPMVLLAIVGSCALAAPVRASFVQTDHWGSAWSAKQFAPASLDFTDAGDLVVGDPGFRRIARVGKDGNLINTFRAGTNGTVTYNSPLNPNGVAADPDGNIYSLSQIDYVVKKFAPDGTLLDRWDLKPEGGKTHGIEYDDSGSILVLRDETVQRYAPDGEFLDSWGGFKSDMTSPVFNTDESGNVLVGVTEITGSVTADKVIYRFSGTGELLSKWATPATVGLSYPYTKCGSPAPYLSSIEGYTGVAARAGGGAWVVSQYDRYHLIEGLSPEGEANAGFGDPAKGRGQLEIDPDGHFWIASNEIRGSSTAEDWAVVSEYDQDGNLIRKYDRYFFPKYFDDDRGEGQFGQLDDLAVGPGGSVDTYEGSNARIQRFTPTGSFTWLTDTPPLRYGLGFSISANQIFYGTDGGVKLLDSAYKRVYSYSSSGTATSVLNLNLPDIVAFGAVGAGTGMWVASGSPLTMSHVDSSGNPTSTFAMPQIPQPYGARASVKIHLTPGGNLMVLSQGVVGEYTAGGTFVRSWTITPIQIAANAGVIDFEVGSDSSVYALISSQTGSSIQTYSPGGQLEATQPIGPQSSYQAYATGIALDSSDDLYLGTPTSVYRYEQVADPPASDSATTRSAPAHVDRHLSSSAVQSSSAQTPADEVCDCSGCYDYPSESDFRLSYISYGKKHRFAWLWVMLPADGQVEVIGGGKVVKRSKVGRAGNVIPVKVALKSRYRHPVQTRKRVKLQVTAMLRFIPDDTNLGTGRLNRKVTLKRKLAHRAGGKRR